MAFSYQAIIKCIISPLLGLVDFLKFNRSLKTQLTLFYQIAIFHY